MWPVVAPRSQGRRLLKETRTLSKVQIGAPLRNSPPGRNGRKRFWCSRSRTCAKRPRTLVASALKLALPTLHLPLRVESRSVFPAVQTLAMFQRTLAITVRIPTLRCPAGQTVVARGNRVAVGSRYPHLSDGAMSWLSVTVTFSPRRIYEDFACYGCWRSVPVDRERLFSAKQ